MSCSEQHPRCIVLPASRPPSTRTVFLRPSDWTLSAAGAGQLAHAADESIRRRTGRRQYNAAGVLLRARHCSEGAIYGGVTPPWVTLSCLQTHKYVTYCDTPEEDRTTAAFIDYLVNFGRAVREICVRTDRQTDRHAHHNSLHASRRGGGGEVII